MDYSGKIIKKTPVVPSQTSASGVWSLDEAIQAQRSNTWPVANVPNPISRSLRFRSSASAYLNRTPSTASNRKTWTWSAWVKLGTIDASNGTLFSAGTGSGETSRFYFRYVSSIFQTGYGSENTDQTVAVFRDPSAWYHVVLAVDTTQATANNRIKIYVNGVQQTIAAGTRFTQNTDTAVNNTVTHSIARDHIIPGGYFDGYMTEINLIDGQQLTPSSFGGTNAVTGVWEPRQYTGTYGTNGFYLNFKDNTSTSTLGLDYSGNNNTWTTNNISLTAGSTYDSMLDVPTQWIAYGTDAVSVTRGNYAVLNPLDKAASSTITNANLSGTNPGNTRGLTSTLHFSSGKFYWEVLLVSTNESNAWTVGCADSRMSGSQDIFGGTFSTFGYYNTEIYVNGVSVASVSGLTTNDIVGVAVDATNNQASFYKNGTLQATVSISSGILWKSFLGQGSGAALLGYTINFGQRPFSYTPPAGFLALCTTNLPSSTILQGDDYFNILLWTGNATNPRTISGLGFEPDMTWYKSRSISGAPAIYDDVRGYGSGKMLCTNQASIEGVDDPYSDSEYGFLTQNSDGIVLNSGSVSGVWVNNNTQTYVGWNWKASGTSVSNTAGSITSTVSANTTAGFSIVTYTGNGSSGATVGHGLGVAPRMVIVKKRNGADQWFTNHTSASATAGSYLKLDSSAAVVSGNADVFNNTNPSSTVVTLGTDNGTNASGGTYVAYCFSEVAGYSKFSSYIGNANADGTFVYLGFRPRYVMIKRVLDVEDWIIFDTARNPSNLTNLHLYANLSAAQSTAVSGVIDIVSNGFKIRGTGGSVNGSGETYIYMAFAENPFKNALAR